MSYSDGYESCTMQLLPDLTLFPASGIAVISLTWQQGITGGSLCSLIVHMAFGSMSSCPPSTALPSLYRCVRMSLGAQQP